MCNISIKRFRMENFSIQKSLKLNMDFIQRLFVNNNNNSSYLHVDERLTSNRMQIDELCFCRMDIHRVRPKCLLICSIMRTLKRARYNSNHIVKGESM